MKKIVFLFISGTLLFSSCRVKPSKSTIETSDTTRTQRPVNIIVPEDSSEAAFVVEVDSATKKPTIKEIMSTQNDRAGKPIAYIDTNGILKIKCPCLEFKGQAMVTDTKISNSKITTITKPIYINEPTKWQWFQIYSGRFLYILILVVAAFRFIRSRLGL
jgi:hypothetical protein